MGGRPTLKFVPPTLLYYVNHEVDLLLDLNVPVDANETEVSGESDTERDMIIWIWELVHLV